MSRIALTAAESPLFALSRRLPLWGRIDNAFSAAAKEKNAVSSLQFCHEREECLLFPQSSRKKVTRKSGAAAWIEQRPGIIAAIGNTEMNFMSVFSYL